jgi:hypothetical protein
LTNVTRAVAVPLRAIVHGDTVAFVVSGCLTLALWTLLAPPFSRKRE